LLPLIVYRRIVITSLQPLMERFL